MSRTGGPARSRGRAPRPRVTRSITCTHMPLPTGTVGLSGRGTLTGCTWDVTTGPAAVGAGTTAGGSTMAATDALSNSGDALAPGPRGTTSTLTTAMTTS